MAAEINGTLTSRSGISWRKAVAALKRGIGLISSVAAYLSCSQQLALN